MTEKNIKALALTDANYAIASCEYYARRLALEKRLIELKASPFQG